MNSQEADKFMLEHPEVAVKVLPVETNGIRYRGWMVFDYPDDNSCRQMCGVTREEAIAAYRDIYHPVKSDHGNSIWDFVQVSQFYKDSAKYRKIVAEYKHYQGSGFCTHRDMVEASAVFSTHVAVIIRDDLESHCNKCGQSLDKDTT